jgi:hypothetical protein
MRPNKEAKGAIDLGVKRSRSKANPVLIESGFALFPLRGRIFGRRTGIHPRIKSEGMLRLKMLYCTGSILEAAITAWVRLSTPSFCKIAETCAFTVASETDSS